MHWGSRHLWCNSDSDSTHKGSVLVCDALDTHYDCTASPERQARAQRVGKEGDSRSECGALHG